MLYDQCSLLQHCSHLMCGYTELGDHPSPTTQSYVNFRVCRTSETRSFPEMTNDANGLKNTFHFFLTL